MPVWVPNNPWRKEVLRSPSRSCCAEPLDLASLQREDRVDDLTEKACETDERREHIRQILSYLERSKHHLYRYAEGPGYLLAPTGWTRGVPCVQSCEAFLCKMFHSTRVRAA
jgi:hypothetical protein